MAEIEAKFLLRRPDQLDDVLALLDSRGYEVEPAGTSTHVDRYFDTEDWAILRALSERMGQTLPFNNLQELRARMYAVAPHLAAIGSIEPADMGAVTRVAQSSGAALSADPFTPAFPDFYFTNPIARASAVMAELSALRRTGAARAAAE